MLVDRGWRRSGTLFYLPDAARSCCPHYTIRLPAAEFKSSRDQRQALHRWNRYVLGEAYLKEFAIKNPKSKASKKKESTFDLLTTVHASETTHTDPAIFPTHTFTTTLEPATFTEEKFALFSNYQTHVHHDPPSEITRQGFTRFLCVSPLHSHTSPNNNNPDTTAPTGKKLGTFHHCYRLNNRLIALSVLDLLPHAVSGVYFLYHSDFAAYSFGKLSALREVALALEEGYGFYYMGYYIEGCAKMRYKAEYRPQQVLKPRGGGFGWRPLDEGVEKFTAGKGLSGERERERGKREAAGSSLDFADDEALGEEQAEEGEEFRLSTPLEASNSGLSLRTLGMPGLTSSSRLDLGGLKVYLGPRVGVHEMRELVAWSEEEAESETGVETDTGKGSETEEGGMRSVIADYAAAVGSEVARRVVVDFSR